MPIVTVEAIVNWRGSSGKVAVGIATSSAATAVNTDLVTNSRATRSMLRRICRPSATMPGTTAKSFAHEHEIGDRARHLRARALRDREPRLLERGHVVHAVADHRHVAPVGGERLDDRALALGRDAADRRRRHERLAQRGRLGRERLAVERRGRSGDARVAGDRAHGRRRVAREDLQRDLLLDEERDRLGRVRSQPLGEHDEAERPHVVRELRLRAGVERRVGAADREHAPAARGLDAGALHELRVGGGEALRRSQHEALVAQVERAPAPPRGERHLRHDATPVGVGEPRVGDRLQRQVARGRAARVPGKRAGERRLVHARRRA